MILELWNIHFLKFSYDFKVGVRECDRTERSYNLQFQGGLAKNRTKPYALEGKKYDMEKNNRTLHRSILLL